MTNLEIKKYRTNPSDLNAFAHCEFEFARTVDKKLGKPVEDCVSDSTAYLDRARKLGYEHENRYRDSLRNKFGDGFFDLSRDDKNASIYQLHKHTLEALKNKDAQVIFQGAFCEENPAWTRNDAGLEFIFTGFSDFLERDSNGNFQVIDTKLASYAKGIALLQLAAYHEQLVKAAVPVSDTVGLVLGTNERVEFNVKQAYPVLKIQRERMLKLILSRKEDSGVIAWGSTEAYPCLACDVCRSEMIEKDDIGLAFGMRNGVRENLRELKIETLSGLAAIDMKSPEITHITEKLCIPVDYIDSLSKQAKAQLESTDEPKYFVSSMEALSSLPAPHEEDIFLFAFEDTLHLEENVYTDETVRGITCAMFAYQNGEVESFFAADGRTERDNLKSLMDWLTARRENNNTLSVYVFDSNNKNAFDRAAVRAGLEDYWNWFNNTHGVICITNIVRDALILGTPDISLEAIGAFVGMSVPCLPETIDAKNILEVNENAIKPADSLSEIMFARYQTANEFKTWMYGLSLLTSSRPFSQNLWDRVVKYFDSYRQKAADSAFVQYLDETMVANHADRIISHSELMKIERIKKDDEGDSSQSQRGANNVRQTDIARNLQQAADNNTDVRVQNALRLLYAGVDYWKREKIQWSNRQCSFEDDPIDFWRHSRDVFWVNQAESSRLKFDGSKMVLRGTYSVGSDFSKADKLLAVYDMPAHKRAEGDNKRRILLGVSLMREPDVRTGELIVSVGDRKKHDLDDRLPLAVVYNPFFPEGKLPESVSEFAQSALNMLERGGGINPVWQVLTKGEPRFVSGKTIQQINAEVEAELKQNKKTAKEIQNEQIFRAVSELKHSTLAVQGPPGTGKTTLGANLLKRLVMEKGWQIGVVAQSHQVIENLLEKTVCAGVPIEQVVKDAKDKDDQHKFSNFAIFQGPEDRYAPPPKEVHKIYSAKNKGCVTGDTAWKFANSKQYDYQQLDLLVVDEAGQFSLAMLIAAARAAKRILLLGDPSQLPQVSTCVHPYPVDTSALNWILGNHATIPENLGYFMADSYRMQPEVCAVVSEMMYDGKLQSAKTERETVIGKVPAGVFWEPVKHRGRTVESPEEVKRVIEIIARLMWCKVRDCDGNERDFSFEDVIVVTPYNAQVNAIKNALEEMGMSEIRVGTVDKFQGQEALVSIVSLAASSINDVSRGVEFLLMPNRLNVAISRAKWASYLVSSEGLANGFPQTAEGIIGMSAYLRVLEQTTKKQYSQ